MGSILCSEYLEFPPPHHDFLDTQILINAHKNVKIKWRKLGRYIMDLAFSAMHSAAVDNKYFG